MYERFLTTCQFCLRAVREFEGSTIVSLVRPGVFTETRLCRGCADIWHRFRDLIYRDPNNHARSEIPGVADLGRFGAGAGA